MCAPVCQKMAQNRALLRFSNYPLNQKTLITVKFVWLTKSERAVSFWSSDADKPRRSGPRSSKRDPQQDDRGGGIGRRAFRVDELDKPRVIRGLNMKNFVRMIKDESGASAAEYALILAIVGSAIALAAITLGGAIANAMDDAASCISTDGQTC